MGQLVNEALTSIVKGEIDYLNDTISVILTTGAADIDAVTYVSDITGEISGGGYTRQTLANKTVTTDDTNDRTVADADDVQWTSLSNTFRYIHVVQDTGNDATSRVLTTIDTGSSQALDNGTYDVTWPVSGVFYIQNPALFMAIVYQSVQSASSADSALVITKPTSLAVGDTLFAGIYFSDDSSGSGGISTPAGWTLLSTTNTGTPTHEVLAVFIKEADSSDVAASNFTFTRSGADSSYHMIGHLLRITDFGILAGSTSDTDINLTTTVTAATFTPTRAATLFIALLANSAPSGAISNASVALATDNPTWTERAETQQSDTSRDSTLTLYTATRAETTATGTITGTADGSVAIKHLHAYSLSSQVDGSINPTTYVNAYALSPIKPSAPADAYVEDPTTATGTGDTQWTNETIPSTSWTNEII